MIVSMGCLFMSVHRNTSIIIHSEFIPVDSSFVVDRDYQMLAVYPELYI